MTDEIIVQQLKNRELQLLNELNRVRIALTAFINDSISARELPVAYANVGVPERYDKALTYSGKILYVLSKSDAPLLVDEITDELHRLEPELDPQKLHKSISHNVSMLAKYSRVKKHPFNRKIKYSL